MLTAVICIQYFLSYNDKIPMSFNNVAYIMFMETTLPSAMLSIYGKERS